MDLPFAHARLCGAEGIEKAVSVSDLRRRDFGARYGVGIQEGPLAGLLARDEFHPQTDGPPGAGTASGDR